MTYLQRADKDGKTRLPFYYMVTDKKDKHERVLTLCISHNCIDFHYLSRGFFEPYIKITENEFMEAKKQTEYVIQHTFGL